MPCEPAEHHDRRASCFSRPSALGDRSDSQQCDISRWKRRLTDIVKASFLIQIGIRRVRTLRILKRMTILTPFGYCACVRAEATYCCYIGRNPSGHNNAPRNVLRPVTVFTFDENQNSFESLPHTGHCGPAFRANDICSGGGCIDSISNVLYVVPASIGLPVIAHDSLFDPSFSCRIRNLWLFPLVVRSTPNSGCPRLTSRVSPLLMSHCIDNLLFLDRIVHFGSSLNLPAAVSLSLIL